MNPESTGEIIPLGESPETSILPRIAGGEKNAFRECVEKHGGMIWRLAKHYADSETVAEAMTLEIFRELWKCAAGFDPEHCAEEVFIRRIAYRCLLKIRENP